ADEVAAVEKLIADLQAKSDTTQVYLVKLENAWPTDVMALLTDLFARQKASRPVTLAADPGGTGLIVRATPGQFKLMQEIIRQVDVPPTEVVGVHLIPLFSAKPEEVAAKLRPMAEAKF